MAHFPVYGDEVTCRFCHSNYSPTVHGHSDSACNVRPEVKALIDRGNITLEEWKNFRGNSWEFEAMVAVLSNGALMSYAETITSNCTHNTMNTQRPCSNYDEALAVVLVPELLKRLQRYEDLLANKNLELQIHLSSLNPKKE